MKAEHGVPAGLFGAAAVLAGATIINSVIQRRREAKRLKKTQALVEEALGMKKLQFKGYGRKFEEVSVRRDKAAWN